MGKLRRIQKKLFKEASRQWRANLKTGSMRRAGMAPPPPGSLKEGDICPCGCRGIMTMIGGVLTAVTMDVMRV